jgi:hypothetical protein
MRGRRSCKNKSTGEELNTELDLPSTCYSLWSGKFFQTGYCISNLKAMAIVCPDFLELEKANLKPQGMSLERFPGLIGNDK